MKLLPSKLFLKVTPSHQLVMHTLPAELLIEIARHLTWTIDVLNFSLTASRLRTILLPEMYKTVFLFGAAWVEALEMFARRPELCAHIRTLEVDLFYEALRPELQEEVDIDNIAALIEKVSAGLLNLQTFEWSGERLPPDHLFLTLRNTCPRLKNLYLYANDIIFDPASELFKFDDLEGFTLRIEYDVKAAEPAPFQDIPVQLGDMLLQRCPRLDCLSIRLRSMPNMWGQEIDRLLSGVWPKLEFFHLDIEVMDSDPITLWPPISSLSTFFAAHSCLTDLGLTAYAVFPTNVLSGELPPCFGANASLKLTCLEGLVQHAAELPSPEALAELVLGTVVTETSLDRTLPVLRGLTALKELVIEFSDIDASTAIHQIASACPSLTTLHVKFYKTAFDSKQLRDFSGQLKGLRRLQSLIFDKVYSASGVTLLKTALMLLSDNPLLADICIINFEDKRWYQRGHYLMLTDRKGRRYISARESGLDRGYPQGKFGSLYPRGRFSRTFRYALGRDVLGSIPRKFKRMRR
ncbi:hypothetical protein B0H14DRAFT_2821159 [Mycena olivaceomarginata]|nr:hypothetical protein B0H14DRAFT_2821159 [Mycena olivaceomarginata]